MARKKHDADVWKEYDSTPPVSLLITFPIVVAFLFLYLRLWEVEWGTSHSLTYAVQRALETFLLY